MIRFESTGSFKNAEDFLDRMTKNDIYATLNGFGASGVNALSSATPVDSGLTASSWTYEINRSKGRYSITWSNTHVVSGAPVAILLQYGHGTGTGGWVEGRDYINPAIRPIFDKMADEVWKAVTK